MFFFISKMVEFFLLPSNAIGLLGLFGVLALIVRRQRLGLRCLIASASLLAVFGWSPIGPAALMVLEERFPQPALNGPISGIILLGGAVDTHISVDRHTLALNDAAERLTATFSLSQRYPDARVFLSGGASHLVGNARESESEVARDLLESMGIPGSRIEMEERSRNTCENGFESAASVKPKPGETWLLVTSASHMPRAIACFRAANFNVVPYPVDYRSRGDADLRRPTASITIGLTAADLAAHEWIGLATYRIAGHIDDIFPGP